MKTQNNYKSYLELAELEQIHIHACSVKELSRYLFGSVLYFILFVLCLTTQKSLRCLIFSCIKDKHQDNPLFVFI